MDENEAKRICDIIRQTGYDIQAYFGKGFLKEIYANALYKRLKKTGLNVGVKSLITVFDEDGTTVGEHIVDILVENAIIVLVFYTNTIEAKHMALLQGYLKASRLKHGMLINFGSDKYEVKKRIN
ncbi:MAG: GxxExxY protein [Defluviitaleaceae bacterium]|nr:GxxExxY protein [Defluviitaleaceae bacterium]MCL2835903.1 GxxExxY protein [Defluviitaleaceae bacterium]